ncbi:MAG: Trk system potassium transporter TrkA [Deltaproteobacteria bacterium]|nr:Trk system potassium transporter TrkA [Deltaproteobacteria bacterium]
MKVIIVGAGEVGFHIAGRLSLENKDVVLIDKDMDSIRRVTDHIDVQTIHGSGSSPAVLDEAGIRGAEILLAVTNSDETNLVACLAAHIISPNTKKLARLRDAAYDPYHQIFKDNPPHIDTIINPEIEVVDTIDRLLSVPGAADVSDFEGGRIKFVGVTLDATSRMAGAALSDLPDIFGDSRPLIAAIVRNEELIVPSGNDRLIPDDLVYFICKQNILSETLEMFDKHDEPLKRVLIVGGGRIGYRLAALLEKKSIHTKIIEQSNDRCNALAKTLNKTVVLCGDGSDQDLLREENIRDMDALVAVTDNEETNILVSLLGKRMGARNSITKISRFSYFPLLSTIGVDQVVSTRRSSISSILQHIRRGKILSATTLKGEQAEVLEAVALETSDIIGKPIKKVAFPKGALLVSVVRKEDIIIPTGDTVVQPGDKIIIFAKRQAVPKIEKILTVKLEFF